MCFKTYRPANNQNTLTKEPKDSLRQFNCEYTMVIYYRLAHWLLTYNRIRSIFFSYRNPEIIEKSFLVSLYFPNDSQNTLILQNPCS